MADVWALDDVEEASDAEEARDGDEDADPHVGGDPEPAATRRDALILSGRKPGQYGSLAKVLGIVCALCLSRRGSRLAVPAAPQAP